MNDQTLAKITINAVVNAPLQKVWDYYSQPEHVTKWSFADESWHSPRAENDLRTGGKFLTRMEAKDGSAGFDFEGIYDSVEQLKSFQYTMSDGRTVSTAFTDMGEQTEITVTFDPETENEPEFQRQGWQAILDNFKEYVEQV